MFCKCFDCSESEGSCSLHEFMVDYSYFCGEHFCSMCQVILTVIDLLSVWMEMDAVLE